MPHSLLKSFWVLQLAKGLKLANMTSKKPRYVIAESDSLSRGLSIAGQRWPEIREDKAALIQKLLETGTRGVENELARRQTERMRQIQKVAGSMDVWPSNWRQETDSQWPQ